MDTTGKVTITLKGGLGQNSPWIVLEGSVADVLSNLGVAPSGEDATTQFHHLVESVAKASEHFARAFSKAERDVPAASAAGEVSQQASPNTGLPKGEPPGTATGPAGIDPGPSDQS
jgi:hypothetical protein